MGAQAGLRLCCSQSPEDRFLAFEVHILFDLGVKVTQKVAKFPLYHVTHALAKFKIATFNEKMKGARTEERTTTDFSTKLILSFFLKKKKTYTQ